MFWTNASGPALLLPTGTPNSAMADATLSLDARTPLPVTGLSRDTAHRERVITSDKPVYPIEKGVLITHGAAPLSPLMQCTTEAFPQYRLFDTPT
eukprot:scaffold150602_cov35-Tisochrysis_lutea.AAC.2